MTPVPKNSAIYTYTSDVNNQPHRVPQFMFTCHSHHTRERIASTHLPIRTKPWCLFCWSPSSSHREPASLSGNSPVPQPTALSLPGVWTSWGQLSTSARDSFISLPVLVAQSWWPVVGFDPPFPGRICLPIILTVLGKSSFYPQLHRLQILE